jgi:drug/metabolite transporter (DMT)-like permease
MDDERALRVQFIGAGLATIGAILLVVGLKVDMAGWLQAVALVLGALLLAAESILIVSTRVRKRRS